MRSMRMRRIPRGQRGATLILTVAILILGVSWATLSALDKSATRTVEREIRTGQALNAAKRALLGYVALKAADSTEKYPGRFPCPESPGQPGTVAEGIAAPVVSPSFPTCSSLGRLPWRTLGIDQLRDGYEEPLWYAVPTGTWALVNSVTTLTINPNLGNQLTLDFQPNSVVALIIAPGTPIYSMSEPGVAPAGCAKVNQPANRYTVPYDPANFLECGNATGSYITAAAAPWGNDRVIAITKAEVMDAIAGPVADRIQRQVAPALADWRTNQSLDWGISFFPYASAFSDPSTNNLCGAFGQKEGLMPTAGATSGNCDTAWQSGSGSGLPGLTFIGCAPQPTGMRCQFQSVVSVSFGAHLSVLAPNVAGSFRSKLASGDITVTMTCLLPLLCSASATNLVHSITASGQGKLDFDLSLPLLQPLTTVTVDIKNLQDASVLSDTRLNWFLGNGWQRHTYYAVAPSATAHPVACAAQGDPGCMEVHGLSASSIGNYWEKRLVLALMGPALPGQSRACTDALDAAGLPAPNGIPDCQEIVNYLEEKNNKSLGYRIFRADLHVTNPGPGAALPYPAFNDRLAVCPYQLATTSGSTTICN